MIPVVVVHGGAGKVDPERLPEHIAGCARAASLGLEVLLTGGSALDAAQRAVEDLEDDPIYNAGTGGSLTRDGTLELDAAVMDGRTLDVGAVCALPPFPHPIRIARCLLDHPRHVMLAARGAAEFATSKGFERSESMITDTARTRLQRWQAGRVGEGWAGGTVGAVACDAEGHLAAATSTGGTVGKHPGRVGDSPIAGAGTWADDTEGACSATGIGEPILRIGLARLACFGIADGAQVAAQRALATMERRVGGAAGLILVTPAGDVGVARTTATMSHAIARAGKPVVQGS